MNHYPDPDDVKSVKELRTMLAEKRLPMLAEKQAAAPYTDPDGYPSYQSDPAVRELDAWARRQRRLHLACVQAEAEVTALRKLLQRAEERLVIAENNRYENEKGTA